jgi:hypothetical protein
MWWLFGHQAPMSAVKTRKACFDRRIHDDRCPDCRLRLADE